MVEKGHLVILNVTWFLVPDASVCVSKAADLLGSTVILLSVYREWDNIHLVGKSSLLM